MTDKADSTVSGPLVIHCASGPCLARARGRGERVNAAGDRVWRKGLPLRTDGEWRARRDLGGGECIETAIDERELKRIIAKSGWMPSPLRQRQVWERLAKDRLDALEHARRSL